MESNDQMKDKDIYIFTVMISYRDDHFPHEHLQSMALSSSDIS